MEARLAKIRAKEKAQRDRFMRDSQGHKKRKLDPSAVKLGVQDDAEFVLDDYDSDQEAVTKLKKNDTGDGLSADTLALMDKLGMVIKPRQDDEGEDEDEIKAKVTDPGSVRYS